MQHSPVIQLVSSFPLHHQLDRPWERSAEGYRRSEANKLQTGYNPEIDQDSSLSMENHILCFYILAGDFEQDKICSFKENSGRTLISLGEALVSQTSRQPVRISQTTWIHRIHIWPIRQNDSTSDGWPSFSVSDLAGVPWQQGMSACKFTHNQSILSRRQRLCGLKFSELTDCVYYLNTLTLIFLPTSPKHS